MKKLLIVMLAALLALIAFPAVAQSIGPPGDIVAFAAPVDYNVAQDQRAINGTTLAGYEFRLAAALEAIGVTLLIAAIVVAVWAISEANIHLRKIASMGVGYHARDQTVAVT